MIEITDRGWLAEERKTTKNESANKGTEEGIERRVALHTNTKQFFTFLKRWARKLLLLVRKSQICKFPRWASPQSANLQICNDLRIETRVAYKYKTIFHLYAKVGTHIYFVSTQISNLQISEVCQSAKRKFAHFLCLTVHKSQMRKFARTKVVFLIQIRIDLPQIFFLTYVSHVTVKPKVVLKFEWEHFKLTFVRRKLMYLRVCLANRKSSNIALPPTVWADTSAGGICSIAYLHTSGTGQNSWKKGTISLAYLNKVL